MRRLLFSLAVACVSLAVAPGLALAEPKDNANGNAENSQGGSHSQAGDHSQGQGQANGRTQSTEQAQQGGNQTQSTSSTQGANQSGPYDPNGVGQPSGNGRSESNQGNRPCAGCVGNADAKNPPGQLPGGHDANRGYECDENQGVGKTNPAHSGCGQARPPGGPGEERETPPAPQEQVAPAQQPAPPPPGGDVLRGGPREGEDQPGDRPGDERTPVSAAPRADRGLPFTGVSLLLMTMLGAAMVGIGQTLQRVRL